jgi:hypothetical protein
MIRIWSARYARLATVVLAIAVIWLWAGDVSACPTCREGVGASDPHQQALAAGFYYSILFMLSMPVIILTTFGSCAYRAVKRAQAERDTAVRNSGDLLDCG